MKAFHNFRDVDYIHEYIPQSASDSPKIRKLAEQKLDELGRLSINEKSKFLNFMKKIDDELLGIEERKKSKDEKIHIAQSPVNMKHLPVDIKVPSLDSLNKLKNLRQSLEDQSGLTKNSLISQEQDELISIQEISRYNPNVSKEYVRHNSNQERLTNTQNYISSAKNQMSAAPIQQIINRKSPSHNILQSNKQVPQSLSAKTESIPVAFPSRIRQTSRGDISRNDPPHHHHHHTHRQHHRQQPQGYVRNTSGSSYYVKDDEANDDDDDDDGEVCVEDNEGGGGETKSDESRSGDSDTSEEVSDAGHHRYDHDTAYIPRPTITSGRNQQRYGIEDRRSIQQQQEEEEYWQALSLGGLGMGRQENLPDRNGDDISYGRISDTFPSTSRTDSRVPPIEAKKHVHFKSTDNNARNTVDKVISRPLKDIQFIHNNKRSNDKECSEDVDRSSRQSDVPSSSSVDSTLTLIATPHIAVPTPSTSQVQDDVVPTRKTRVANEETQPPHGRDENAPVTSHASAQVRQRQVIEEIGTIRVEESLKQDINVVVNENVLNGKIFSDNRDSNRYQDQHAQSLHKPPPSPPPVVQEEMKPNYEPTRSATSASKLKESHTTLKEKGKSTHSHPRTSLNLSGLTFQDIVELTSK